MGSGRTKVLGRSGAVTGPPPTPPTRRRCSEALEASTGDRGADWISRGPAGRSRVEDGDGTGTVVCVPRPGTPVDAAAALDGISGVRAAVDDVEPVYAIDATTASEPIGRPGEGCPRGAELYFDCELLMS